jgi:hypothetical protein
MTDASSTSGSTHVDPEVLADLQEGLLDPAAAAAAEGHLAGCAACRGQLAGLEQVRHRLAAADPVGPLPDDLAERLDQALAVAATEPDSTAASRTVIPMRSRQRETVRGMRLLQVAAVLVLLFAGGAVGISALDGFGDGGSDDSAATSAEAGGAPQADASFPVSASGRDWTADTLRDAAPRLAAGDYVPTSAGGLSAGDSGASPEASEKAARELADAPAGRLSGGPALASCAAGLAGAPVTPVAVDLAKYEGKPAAVLLLPTSDDPAAVDVFVVEPTCPPGSFLYFARVPRP